MSASTKISFRAECRGDVDLAIDVISKQYPVSIQETEIVPGFLDVDGKQIPIPDVDVELSIQFPLTIDKVFELMREIEDTHVMYQSLRQLPLSENSLERRWEDEAPLDWTDNSEHPKYASDNEARSPSASKSKPRP